MTDWLGLANGGFFDNSAAGATSVPTQWHIAATGDFNGDGRDDILWRHDDGRMTDWLGLANGGFFDNSANGSTNVPTQWHVAGTGDFNGDGRDDILWRHDDGRMTDWLGLANGGFFDNGANAATSAPTQWHASSDSFFIV
jgi:NADH:ubiquinone oxidoreductase subunit